MYCSGRVLTVLFSDAARAFYIVKMLLDNPERIEVVKGYVPGLAVKIGTWFGFEADEVDHEVHGHQLSITKAPIIKGDWDKTSAINALVAQGVGSQVLALIQENLGDDFVPALDDNAKLAQVPGIDAFTALYIYQRWQVIQSHFKGMNFLLGLNLPPGVIRQVWNTLGENVVDILSKNPWALTRVDGITFQQADEVAGRLGLLLDSQDRINGAVLSTCREHRGMGHLFLTSGQMYSALQALIPGISQEAVGKSIADHHRAKTLVVDRDTRPTTLAIYEPWLWQMEKESAEGLVKRMVTAGFGKKGQSAKEYIQRFTRFGTKTEEAAKKPRAKLIKVAETAVEEWGSLARLALSEDQKRGVVNALTAPVSVLTGLPGTGKTTAMKAVVGILQDIGVKYLLSAPTGIAAKRLGALTGGMAYTIHRAFAAKGSSEDTRDLSYHGIQGESATTGSNASADDKDEKWGYGPHDPYPAEVVVIDESSMLDQHLLYRLLNCTSEKARLVFVGDAAQLPSVGPGNVLRDLIQSGQFPTVNLQDIFRQKDTSDIIYAAHSIFRGEVPACEHPSDCTLIQMASEEAVLATILRLVDRLHQRSQETGMTFQVISPRHAGLVGVTNLNIRLRDLINPSRMGLQEFKLGSDIIREDDRVMVIRNDYKLGIYNGDTGKVSRIDSRARLLEVSIQGSTPLLVRVPFQDIVTTIRLAYAITIHKAQGQECDVVVLPLVDSFKHQLQRNLLYTAVTRAKLKVYMVGSTSALAKAVGNDREDLRNTLLKDRLLSGRLIVVPTGVDRADSPQGATEKETISCPA